MPKVTQLIAAFACLLLGALALWGMNPGRDVPSDSTPQPVASLPQGGEEAGYPSPQQEMDTGAPTNPGQEPQSEAERIEIPSKDISLTQEQRRAAQEMQIAPLKTEEESQEQGNAQSAGSGMATGADDGQGGSLQGESCKWKKTMLSTAYGPPWNSVEGGPITSTGKALVPNRYYIATDPSVIPTGSRVKIWPNPLNYRGVFKAEDVGGAIKGNHVDIFVWQGKSVRDNWKKNVQVCLLD